MTTAPSFRHVPTGRLAVLAQRLGRVVASPTTWLRLVRERGWRRPRARVHPAAPKEGIRACRLDEIRHIDTTVLRLLDGIRLNVVVRSTASGHSGSPSSRSVPLTPSPPGT